MLSGPQAFLHIPTETAPKAGRPPTADVCVCVEDPDASKAPIHQSEVPHKRLFANCFMSYERLLAVLTLCFRLGVQLSIMNGEGG